MAAVATHIADETAITTVAVPVAVDAGAADAVLDEVTCACNRSDNAGVVLYGTVVAAGNDDILDGCTVDVTERGKHMIEEILQTAVC